jgi:beta-lactamase class A
MKKILIVMVPILIMVVTFSAVLAMYVAGDDLDVGSGAYGAYVVQAGEAAGLTSGVSNVNAEVATGAVSQTAGEAVGETSGVSNGNSEAVTAAASQTAETIGATVANTKTNYIYERIRTDSDNLAVLGDLGITTEQYDQLNKLLKGYNQNISIKVVTVDGSKGLSFNSTGKYFSACTIKAPYVLWVYKQLEKGSASFDDKMVYTSKFYHSGSGSIKDSPDGTVFTVREVLRRTIYESDNSGYDMCYDKWGKEGYNAYMDSLGAESMKLDTSNWGHAVMAEDLVIVWSEIYKYFLTRDDNEYAMAFYDSCKSSYFNFFANALPGYTINQKSGWSSSQYGVGAIIWGEKQTYLLALYTDSSGSSYDISVVNKVIKAIDEIMN